jgi:NADPH-dependent 2,4-dienoyl-CoA reductase/sulfur reductase-like enzyme
MCRLPNAMRQRMIRRCMRPAATAWLLPRTAGLKLTYGCRVVSANATPDGCALLTLDDGSTMEADHILLGTGFRPDLWSVPILDAKLRSSILQRDGYPRLRDGFETSVPGLHIVGAMAANSYGPLMRFVSGTWYTAPALARHVARRRFATGHRLASRRLSATAGSPHVARPPA